MLQYENLSPLEFETLCHDIMESMLNTTLHRFPAGKDGGIDLTDNVLSKNIVVQVKHYHKSGYSPFLKSMRAEVEKVKKLQPKLYYVCCSLSLSPKQIKEVASLFPECMPTSQHVITLETIEDFLQSRDDILHKHSKLWLGSFNVLQKLGNTHVFIDCESLLGEIEDEKKFFVATTAYHEALERLNRNRVLMITGNPGVGKTMTSYMLVLYYAMNAYQVRYCSAVTDIRALKNSLSLDPKAREVILLDDCLGQAYFDLAKSQCSELLALIYHVRACENKILILNSRITILNEAREHSDKLYKCFDRGQCRIHCLDMNKLGLEERAKIFYNHIYFSGMSEPLFAEIKKNKRYRDIVLHPNYTPRIIAFVCDAKRYQGVKPEGYYDFVMQQLRNPRKIWHDEYEDNLSSVDRSLLQTLYSLTDTKVEEETVRVCFRHRLLQEVLADKTLDHYEASLLRLLDNFVVRVSDGGVNKLSMVNPSVNDYLDGRLKAGTLDKDEIISKALLIRQVRRVSTDEEFDAYVLDLLRNHGISARMFESEQQRDAFIAYYVGREGMVDSHYTPYLRAYLKKPTPLSLDGKDIIWPAKIIPALFSESICEAHELGEYVAAECRLEPILQFFSLEEVLECLRLLDPFFRGEKRATFVAEAAQVLRLVLENFASDLNAWDFNVDVNKCCNMAWVYDKDGPELIVYDAAVYVEEAVVDEAQNYIRQLLETLPEDIQNACDYVDELPYHIYGAEDLVLSQFDACEEEDDGSWRERQSDRGTELAAVDAIFDRM